MMRDRRQTLMGCFLIFCLVAFLAPTANGLIHKLSIKNDRRLAFRIETFGFFTGGVMEMAIENFKVGSLSSAKVLQKENCLSRPVAAGGG
jgi:hypothetical protein